MKLELDQNLQNICGEVYKRLEDKDSRENCVREILEAKFEGKMSEQEYLFYQFLKVLNEMYKQGFEAGKKVNEQADAEEKDVSSNSNYLNHRTSTRTSAADNFAVRLAPVIQDIKDNGARTLQGIADKLTELGIKTISGYDQWHPATVRHVEKRIAKRHIEVER